jgi:branched-chain amino acid transport system substrate-binding protein
MSAQVIVIADDDRFGPVSSGRAVVHDVTGLHFYSRVLPYLATLLVLIAFQVSAADAQSGGSTSPHAEDAPLRVGFVLPLSGKAQLAGEATKNGAEMAGCNASRPVQLIFEDGALDNVLSLSAARRLIDVTHVHALVVYASGPSNTIAPIAESAGVPMVGMSIDPNVSHARHWVMIHWASNTNVARLLLSELKQRHLRHLAVITTQTQGILELEEYFIREAGNLGMDIVSAIQVLPSEKDFRTIVLQLRSKRPEAVFLNLYYGQAGTFAAQARDAGFTPQYFSHFVLDNEQEVASARGALEGAFFASTGTGDGSFSKDYYVRYGVEPVTGAIAAYDIVGILCQAASIPERAVINRNMHTLLDFQGKIGTYGAQPGNSFAVPASLRVISDGKIVEKRVGHPTAESR